MTTALERIADLEVQLKLLKEQVAEEGKQSYLQQLKELERYFPADLSQAFFRYSCSYRKDGDVKLVFGPAGSPGTEHGLYSSGPSFKFIVSLLMELKRVHELYGHTCAKSTR